MQKACKALIKINNSNHRSLKQMQLYIKNVIPLLKKMFYAIIIRNIQVFKKIHPYTEKIFLRKIANEINKNYNKV